MTNQDTEFAQAAEAEFSEAPPSSEQVQTLGSTLVGEFAKAESDRRLTEQRWLRDLRQYRGQYDPEVLAKIGPARSRAFVRKTRVKVKTTDSRIIDLLFPAGSDKNWSVEHTPKPSISPEMRAEIVAALQQQAMQAQQAQQAQAQQAQQAGQPVPPMQPPQPPSEDMIEAIVLQFAKESAKRMSVVIDDQLSECKYKAVAVKAVHSGNLYGTGVLKGPLVERKVRTRFVKVNGKWVPKSETYITPFVDYVPIWRFYPDMSSTDLEQCQFVYERHMMTRHEMSGLAQRKSFNKTLIIGHIKANPRGDSRLRYWDNELRNIGERDANQGDVGGKYEVLERWGWLNGEQLREAGVKVDDARVHESFFSNVWMLPSGVVIKATVAPINGVTWPYHIYYFDKDETSIFGEGLASIMNDDQTMINAATRMMIDNAARSAGPQLEVTPSYYSNTERVDEHVPWKVWLRNNTAPGAVGIRVIDMPSHVGDLSSMVQMFEANADESTAIPRYMSGENATNGAAGTSSGLSMLMGAVNIVIKDLITAWDEGVTTEFIRALYHWNMQFNKDDSIKGDYDVKATGSASLVAKEVRARQLNELAAQTANEFDAPYVKRDVLNRKRAEANELSDVIKTEDEVNAEQNSPQAQAQQQMGAKMQELQLAELEGKVATMMAKVQEAAAKIDLIKAQSVSEKVGSVYAALQAGGVATNTPYIAPAGDEILRSAGFKDATPDPSIAQLNGPPVQEQQGTTQVLNGGQSFAQQPRGGDPVPRPATGMDGVQAGIETQEIER